MLQFNLKGTQCIGYLEEIFQLIEIECTSTTTTKTHKNQKRWADRFANANCRCHLKRQPKWQQPIQKAKEPTATAAAATADKQSIMCNSLIYIWNVGDFTFFQAFHSMEKLRARSFFCSSHRFRSYKKTKRRDAVKQDERECVSNVQPHENWSHQRCINAKCKQLNSNHGCASHEVKRMNMSIARALWKFRWMAIKASSRIILCVTRQAKTVPFIVFCVSVWLSHLFWIQIAIVAMRALFHFDEQMLEITEVQRRGCIK